MPITLDKEETFVSPSIIFELIKASLLFLSDNNSLPPLNAEQAVSNIDATATLNSNFLTYLNILNKFYPNLEGTIMPSSHKDSEQVLRTAITTFSVILIIPLYYPFSLQFGESFAAARCRYHAARQFCLTGYSSTGRVRYPQRFYRHSPAHCSGWRHDRFSKHRGKDPGARGGIFIATLFLDIPVNHLYSLSSVDNQDAELLYLQ